MALITSPTCMTCGSRNIKREGHDLGYTSGRDLGRPAGAKGRDEMAILDVCADCGGVNIQEQPEPCRVCGGTPTRAISSVSLCEQVTDGALWEHIPGMPTAWNLCDRAECLEKTKKEGLEKLNQAIDDGGFE